MQLTSAQQETIRQRPQQSNLYLSIFQPSIIFKARVNNVNATKGDRTIYFDSVSSGSVLNVRAGMTMWVGTSDGANDLGKVRVRSASVTEIIVAENGNIQWADNVYITVYKFWEIWPVYPRIIDDPNNSDDVIFYKDYDIPYTNQNSILGAYVNAGPHRAAFLDNGQAQLWYSSTGTLPLYTGTLSYSWIFEGGSPTGSTLSDPGYVSYNTPGHYLTYLIVSGSYGQVDTAYRYVSIYNPIASGTSLPYLRWQMEPLSGSRDEGGYTTKITLFQNVESLEEGSVVVIFSDDWYGNTHQSLGGNYPNSSSIFFVGNVMDGSIEYDYEKSQVTFDVGSTSVFMKEMEGFSVSVETNKAPSTWYHVLDMDIQRAIYHYLKWHSTVLSLQDFSTPSINPKLQYFDADRTSLFDAIDSFMRSALVGKLVSDRQGKLWAETNVYLSPTGTYPSVMGISNRDWMGSVNFDESMMIDLSYLERGGIYYSGATTGTFSALMACAPGETPAYRGTARREQGLALNDETHLYNIVKNEYAFETFPFKSINLNLAGNYRNLDIAPQDPVHLRIVPSDTERRVNIDLDYYLDSMSWDYDEKNQFLIPNGTFAPIINGSLYEPIDIPDVPPAGGYNIPPVQLPDIPSISMPSPLGGLLRNATYYAESDSIVNATTYPAGQPIPVTPINVPLIKSYDPTGLIRNYSSSVLRANVSGWYLVTLYLYLNVNGTGAANVRVSIDCSDAYAPTVDKADFVAASFGASYNGGYGSIFQDTVSKLSYLHFDTNMSLTVNIAGTGDVKVLSGVAQVSYILIDQVVA